MAPASHGLRTASPRTALKSLRASPRPWRTPTTAKVPITMKV